MLDNSLQIAFRIVGEGKHSNSLIDPRAARLEYNYKSRTEVGLKGSELKPLPICNTEQVKSKIDFITTPRLKLLSSSYCLP